jgi:hypothetical protein
MTFQQLDIDPVIQAIGDANPASPRDFANLPPLGALPARAPSPARRRAVPLAVAGLLAVGGLTAVALIPESAPGGSGVLERALAAPAGTAQIIHWRVSTEVPGLPAVNDDTNDVWLHVDADGRIDTIHELRVDGPYAGMESVIEQPNGIGDLTGAVDRTRQSAQAPIKDSQGVGFGEYGFTDVVAMAQKAARGGLDLGSARSVSYEGHDAYEIRVRDAVPPAAGGKRSPAEIGITLWVDRHSNLPLGVRYGDGSELFMTERVVSFERLADDAANRARLQFSSGAS